IFSCSDQPRRTSKSLRSFDGAQFDPFLSKEILKANVVPPQLQPQIMRKIEINSATVYLVRSVIDDSTAVKSAKRRGRKLPNTTPVVFVPNQIKPAPTNDFSRQRDIVSVNRTFNMGLLRELRLKRNPIVFD